jgi:hypothetical protein
MHFEFYIVNNMKMSRRFGIYSTSLATSIQTLSNGSNVFSLTNTTTLIYLIHFHLKFRKKLFKRIYFIFIHKFLY